MKKEDKSVLATHLSARIQSAVTPEDKKTVAQKQHDQLMEPHGVSLLEQIVSAQRQGAAPFAMVKDIIRLRKVPGRLTPDEYFLYKLYDHERYSSKDQEAFISERLSWPLIHLCCDMTWSALTEDKWLASKFLAGFDIPIPETLAVIDMTCRSFGDTPTLKSPAALKEFLQHSGDFPIFAKPNAGLGSFGAFIITGTEGDMVFLDQEEPVSYAEFFEKVIGDATYILQKCITNHEVLAALTPYVATVRTLNFMQKDSMFTPCAVIKIPSPVNIADNFWREGNYLAAIDLETGRLQRVVRGKGKAYLEELTTHSETGIELLGLTLPHWEELKQLNMVCAKLFAPLCYNSTDIALTPSGPVVVEINTGGSFQLPQSATGKGLLTEEVLAFFRSHDWKA